MAYFRSYFGVIVFADKGLGVVKIVFIANPLVSPRSLGCLKKEMPRKLQDGWGAKGCRESKGPFRTKNVMAHKSVVAAQYFATAVVFYYPYPLLPPPPNFRERKI